jgi:formylmethanofuran--tetrahydromethanopterin N-formyltransferase
MPATALVEDTFAEAFPMTATRLIITAADQELASIAASAFCGNASSVIGCDVEAGIECTANEEETPDGRPGVKVLVFAFTRDALEKAVASRLGQNVLTCPTTACYWGIEPGEKRIKVGAQLRFFGDGFQIAKKLESRRLWRIPVMDGEFLCDDVAGSVKGIGGGNLIVCGRRESDCLLGAREAVNAIRQVAGVILPFPGGVVRSGSKVGSKYARLKASTNHKWCPSLRGQTDTALLDDEHVAYEIVIDGLSEQVVGKAMLAGLRCLQDQPGVTRVSAGNYGGKLGPHHFHLRHLEGYDS